MPQAGGYKIPTLFEVLSGKLGLDYKVQEPAAQQIFGKVNALATPIITDIFQARQRMLSAEVVNQPDVQKTSVEQYALAATRMAAVEVEAFKQLYATLKPNQQKKAAEGFEIMAGMYLPRTAPGGRGGARPGGGGGAPQGGGGGR